MKETPPKCVRVRALKLTLTLRGPLAIAPNCCILRLELSNPRGSGQLATLDDAGFRINRHCERLKKPKP